MSSCVGRRRPVRRRRCCRSQSVAMTPRSPRQSRPCTQRRGVRTLPACRRARHLARPPRPQDRPGAGRDLPRRALRARLRQPVRAAGRDGAVAPRPPTGGSTRSRPTLFAAYPDAAGDGRRRPRGARADHPARPASSGPRPSRCSSSSPALVERYDGEVPPPARRPGRRCPGVGRKTANVVLGNAFGIPGITVDTHFGRLARRFGWTERDRPGQGRARGRRAVPQEGLDDAVPPPDLARPPGLPRPQPGLRRLPGRALVPGVRRGADRPGDGREAA